LSDIRREIVELLPRLRRIAWAIARSGQESEDLLHRTIVRALSRSESWEEGTPLSIWMTRIMKNLWIDQMRMRGRWSKLVESMPEPDELGDAGDAANSILDQVELGKLRKLVEDLPEEQRMAVKLVILAEHSYREAAAILEIPEGTLTSRLARGRAALLAHYHEKETRH
jgi:RNA polymerase sigma factor (sigma-70 family)